jgi:hypothetical protein
VELLRRVQMACCTKFREVGLLVIGCCSATEGFYFLYVKPIPHATATLGPAHSHCVTSFLVERQQREASRRTLKEQYGVMVVGATEHFYRGVITKRM